jgi:hypothetical protein
MHVHREQLATLHELGVGADQMHLEPVPASPRPKPSLSSFTTVAPRRTRTP